MRVGIVALGPIFERLNLVHLIRDLNKSQSLYVFALEDPLTNVPAPTIPREHPTDSPQYSPDELFKYIHAYRGQFSNTPDNPRVLVGIIDSEIYDEAYSVIDRTNSMILISVRISDLRDILQKSHKTYNQYVRLEIGAQLLALQYRKLANISADPTICEKPWHIERRDCLFDYYGLAPENVQKLISPKISIQVLSDFRQVELPESYMDASLKIVRSASKTIWGEVLRNAPQDPYVVLITGAVLGLVASIFANQTKFLWFFYIGVAVVLIILRLLKIRNS